MLSQQPGLVETPLPQTAAGGWHGNERVAFSQRKGGHGLCQGERRRANAFKFQHQNQFTRLVGIGKSGKGRMDAGRRRSGLKNAAESGERLCAAGAQAVLLVVAQGGFAAKTGDLFGEKPAVNDVQQAEEPFSH